MNRNEKRSITYTVLTIILVIVSINFGGDEDGSLVSYICGLLGVITGFVAVINITDTVKNKVCVKG